MRLFAKFTRHLSTFDNKILKENNYFRKTIELEINFERNFRINFEINLIFESLYTEANILSKIKSHLAPSLRNCVKRIRNQVLIDVKPLISNDVHQFIV
jgi:hypothetical protein